MANTSAAPDDTRDPWARQKGEPKLWYDRFHSFLHAGPDRSLLGLYRQYRREKARESGAEYKAPSSVPASWRSNASDWLWRDRADLFDAAERQKREHAWARRRDELREEEWETYRKMLDRATAMLGFPLTEQEISRQEGPDGTTIVTVVQPAGWKLSDVARIADVATKLGRRAADMGQGRHDITITDWTDFTDEELKEIALGASPVDVRRRRDSNEL